MFSALTSFLVSTRYLASFHLGFKVQGGGPFESRLPGPDFCFSTACLSQCLLGFGFCLPPNSLLIPFAGSSHALCDFPSQSSQENMGVFGRGSSEHSRHLPYVYGKIHACVKSSVGERSNFYIQTKEARIISRDFTPWFLSMWLLWFSPLQRASCLPSLWCECLAAPLSKPKQLSNVCIESARHPVLAGGGPI